GIELIRKLVKNRWLLGRFRSEKRPRSAAAIRRFAPSPVRQSGALWVACCSLAGKPPPLRARFGLRSLAQCKGWPRFVKRVFGQELLDRFLEKVLLTQPLEPFVVVAHQR